MQTILGANGQIAEELARVLRRDFTQDIRLVSRQPKKINDTDSLFPANLLDAAATLQAVRGSEVAYLTVGLPMNTALWEAQFPVMMRNVIAACSEAQTKLVFFDNTYMYPQNGNLQTEETVFAPVGRKGRVRQHIAEMLLAAMQAGQIEAVICRAPEFYGPAKTQSISNTFVFDAIRAGEKLKVPLRDDTLRSLIWTPDASRATALIGNTPDAYGQTWHLPIDEARLTYQQFIGLAEDVFGRSLSYRVISKFVFRVGALFNSRVKELLELLPRYESNNLFDCTKFKRRFPTFDSTSFRKGIEIMRDEKSR